MFLWLGKKYYYFAKGVFIHMHEINYPVPLEEGTIHQKTLMVKQQVFPESLYTYQFIRSKQQISKHVSDSPVYT